MLFVNLIEERLQRKRLGEMSMGIGAGVCLLLILGLVGTWLYYSVARGKVHDRITFTKGQIAQIQPEADAAKALEERIDELKPIQGLAEQAHRSEEMWCNVLSTVAVLLPRRANLVEVSSVTDPLTSARKVRVRGMSLNQQVLSDFIIRLNASGVFVPELTFLTDLGTQQVGDVSVKSWFLELTIAGTAKPPPQPAAPAQEGTKG